MCNPDQYGFSTIEKTEELMLEILRVLKKNSGKIIMICRHDNKYCNPKRVKKRIDSLLEKYSSLNLRVETTPIDSITEYKDYIFKRTDGGRTFPNYKITIYVN